MRIVVVRKGAKRGGQCWLKKSAVLLLLCHISHEDIVALNEILFKLDIKVQ